MSYFWTGYILVSLIAAAMAIGETAWVYRHPTLNGGKQLTIDLADILIGAVMCLIPMFHFLLILIMCIFFLGSIATSITVFGKKS